MPPESPGSMGLDAPELPDDDWASGEPPDEPDPDWPDDWPDDDRAGASWMTPAPGGRGGGGGPPRRLLALAAVAVVALAAGAGVALLIGRSHAPAPAAAASRPPPLAAPGGNGSSGGARPGSGAGGGTIQMFADGQVLAVSGTSITIGGPDHRVTAAVTSSTRITGRVGSIRAVKVGDQVTAQITQSGGRAVATAIQDPAQLPSGASLP
jgi:hypothetical protein